MKRIVLFIFSILFVVIAYPQNVQFIKVLPQYAQGYLVLENSPNIDHFEVNIIKPRLCIRNQKRCSYI